MSKLNPVIARIPEKLARDPELEPFFRYLTKYLNDLAKRDIQHRKDINAIGASVDGVLAKLDSDAGVTDTDYESIHGRDGSGVALPDALQEP